MTWPNIGDHNHTDSQSCSQIEHKGIHRTRCKIIQVDTTIDLHSQSFKLRQQQMMIFHYDEKTFNIKLTEMKVVRASVQSMNDVQVMEIKVLL